MNARIPRMTNLSGRLFLTILAGILPLVILTVIEAYQTRSRAMVAGMTEAHHWTETAVDQHRQLSTTAERILGQVITGYPQASDRTHTCTNFLRRVMEVNTEVRDLSVLTPDGLVLCGAYPQQQPADAAMLNRTPRTGQVISGEISINPFTGIPEESFAAWFDDHPGGPVIVIATVSLDWLVQVSTDVQAHFPGTDIEIINAQGKIAMHYPGPGKWQNSDAPAALKMAIRTDQDMIQAVDADSVQRLYGISSIHQADDQKNWYVAVGYPAAAFLSTPTQNLRMDLISIVVVFLVGLLLARLFSNWVIVRKLWPVIVCARRIESGDMTARSGIAREDSDFGRLGRAFDRMACALEQRSNELHHAIALYRDLFNNSPIGLCHTADDGQIIEANPALSQILGYPSPEDLPENISDVYVDLTEREQWKKEIAHHGLLLNKETHFRRADGAIITILINSRVARDDVGRVVFYNNSIQDITEAKKAENMIRHMAYHDPLTGLANRKLFEQELTRAIARANRRDERLAVLFIDMDCFKQINDRYGHTIGDAVLVEAARRLRAGVRAEEMAARLGGDEFTILAELSYAEDVTALAERLIGLFDEPVLVEKYLIYINLSIGISLYPSDTSNPDLLIRLADQAMYVAKRAGKHCYRMAGDTLVRPELPAVIH